MLFITGPLYSGKRTFAAQFGGRQIYEVQDRAAKMAGLQALADELAAYDVVTATEVGGGIVPIATAEQKCVTPATMLRSAATLVAT